MNGQTPDPLETRVDELAKDLKLLNEAMILVKDALRDLIELHKLQGDRIENLEHRAGLK